MAGTTSINPISAPGTASRAKGHYHAAHEDNPHLWRCNTTLTLRTEAFYLRLQLVAHFQVLWRFHSEANACGCSSRDQVARFERHELRNVTHKFTDIENHIARAAVLFYLAVHAQGHPQLLYIRNFVGRNKPRAKGIERVAALSFC